MQIRWVGIRREVEMSRIAKRIKKNDALLILGYLSLLVLGVVVDLGINGVW